MSLRDLWISTPEQIREKHVQQVIAFAGEGKLLDGGSGSHEFRTLLTHIPSQLLGRYASECLLDSFPNSGLALQDVVNEVGRRLGFAVTAGRYRGVSGQIGFDGLWLFPTGHGAVVEVKTTDAYRIDLDTIANYRRALVAEGRLSDNASSMLIVVGRQDTGDLEAQIRGSRHAWDIRLISIEALLRLLALKEELEDPGTVRRIHAVLIPREFTRLDDIVDLVFSTAEEVRQDELPQDDDDEPQPNQRREPKFVPVAFHEACVERIQIALKVPLVRESRASFVSPDRGVVIVCAVSKAHERMGAAGYWFAFHPHQKESLETAARSYVAFGCGSAEQVVLIPFADFRPWLDQLNVTERPDRMYWHVKIRRDNNSFSLIRSGGARIDLTPYIVTDGAAP
jgi:hypothetical protein